MSFIMDKLWRLRYGGQTGLNQASNSVKMTAYIAGPFIAVWFVIQLFVPTELVDMFTLLGFFGWLGYVFVMYARAKSDASSYFPFPQAHWFFQDGQQITVDNLVPPNGYELIASYEDGSKLYRVFFNEKCEYHDIDRPYPDVFGKALWKLPAEWTEAFQRQGHGEFFFKNIFVDHPACESIEVYVVGWKEKGGTREPVCVINGCSHSYQKLLANPTAFQNQEINEADSIYAIYRDQELEINELRERNAYLEREAQQYYREGPEDIKKLSDNRMSRARKKVGHIMDTSPPLWSRIFNLKTFGIIILILGLVLLASHFWLGFP